MSLKRVFFLFLGSRFIEKNLFRKLNLNRSKGILKRGGGGITRRWVIVPMYYGYYFLLADQ